MPGSHGRSWVLKWSFTAAAAGGLLAVAWQYRPAVVLQYLREQMATGSDAEAVAAIRQLPACGEAGILVAVEALASPRMVVVAEARTVLNSEIDRWGFLPSGEAHRRLDHLLAALANDGLPAVSQQFAVAAAMRALRWPAETSQDRSALLANCELILRTQSQATPAESVRPDVPAFVRPDAFRVAERVPESAGVSIAVETANALPGGAIPVEITPAPRGESFGSTSAVANSAPEAVTAGFVEQPLRFPTATIAKPLHRTTEGPTGVDALAEALTGDSPKLLENEPTIVLIRQLPTATNERSVALRTELGRRGFGPVEFELASRLTSADPAVRQQMVEALPRLRVDARPWLLWLSEDEDPDIRFAAAGLMATSDEPQMLKRLAELAATDFDSRVQAVAARAVGVSRQ